MKPHTKAYLKYFNFDISDFIPCELCGNRAVDIHHIEARGMGASTTNNDIDNLMALCRECHVRYGDKKHFKEELKIRHNKYILQRSYLN